MGLGHFQDDVSLLFRAAIYLCLQGVKQTPHSARTGQLIDRGKNRWLIRWPIGHRKYVSKTLYGTKEEAEAVLRKLAHLPAHSKTEASEILNDLAVTH